MKRYDPAVTEAIRERVPRHVREALQRHGWNELGVYEAVKEALASVKRRGGGPAREGAKP